MKLHLHKRHDYWLVDHEYDDGTVWARNAFPTFDQARFAVVLQLMTWEKYANTQ